MGSYAPGKIPEGKFLDPRWLFTELLKLKTAINTLDTSNFPNKVNGSAILNPSSVGFTETSGYGEYRVPILALAAPYTTTSITLVNVGPYALFDPARWADITADKVFLELSGGPASAGTTTVELHDTIGALVSVAITTIGINYVTAALTRLPTSSQALVLKVKSSVGTVTSQLTGANILIRP